MTETADRLNVISKSITTLTVAVPVLAAVIMFAAFYLISNERKREFAVLRTIGFSRSGLSRLVLTEALITAGAGGIAGVILTAAAVLPFVGVIEQKTALPVLAPKVSETAAYGAAVVAIVLLTGSLSAALSAYKLSHIDTGKILREGC